MHACNLLILVFVSFILSPSVFSTDSDDQASLCIHVEVINDNENDGPFGGVISRTGKAEFVLKVQPSGGAGYTLYPVNTGQHSGAKSIVIRTRYLKRDIEHDSLTIELLDRDKAETKAQKALRDALKASACVLVDGSSVYAISQGVWLPAKTFDNAKEVGIKGVEYITTNPDKTLFDSYGSRTVHMKGISAEGREQANPLTILKTSTDQRADLYIYYDNN